MNRSTLLAVIAAGREHLDAAIADLAAERMLDQIDVTWTRKDVIAHLEAWERRVIENLEMLRRGGEPDGSVTTDELNDRFFACNRDRTLDDVLAGERDAYRAVLAAINGATDEELFDSHHFGWTEGDPFADWLRANTDEHYVEHFEQLTRAAR
ncbi:MAG: ClbS/DfsB family four-helix bundle protein [Candidatus Eisenbacteria bacterium]|uniref:ClbS/DfsB family four-helix bundle protein n=1 Tax=Eiseniibacteriota bacterium TaxID=2212470 RepID=A0A538UBP8_UNCEI|nr:MAG: ClbS/DfsB family four-helix bundle protein [Candidatus Eisenbacteria bacterium]